MISLLLLSTISGIGVLSILVLFNVFSKSDILKDNYLLSFALIVCSISLPLYLIIITVRPPVADKRWLGCKFTFVSTIDFLTSGIVMYTAMTFMNISVNFFEMESIFIVATIAGIISMVPGGFGAFGAFDLFFLLGATQELNLDKSLVLTSVVLYRIVYYLIPFIIGLFLATSEIQNLLPGIKYNNQFTILSKELGSVVFEITKTQIFQIIRFFMALIFLISTIYFIFDGFLIFMEYQYVHDKLLDLILPIYICFSTFVLFEIKGVIIGSKETYDNLLYKLSIITICEVYFLIVYRSIIGFLLVLMLWIGLFSWKNWLNVNVIKRTLSEKISYIIIITTVLFELFIIKNDYQYNNHILFVIISTFIIFILASIISRIKLRRTQFIRSNDKSELKNLLAKYEGNNLSHLGFLDRNKFFIDKDKEVGIIFQETQHDIFILGDPIGNQEQMFPFLKDFMQTANKLGKYIIFYQTSKKFLDYYNDLSFNIFKLGEEGIVDLDLFSLSGKKIRGFRATLNQMEKSGYKFEIIEPKDIENYYYSLQQISNRWLRGKREITFSVGEFEEKYIKRTPVGIIEDKSNKILGFLTVMPTYTRDTISIDLIRWDPDVDIAMMDTLYLNIMLWAKEEGYKEFNLGMAPFSNSYNNNLYLKNTVFSSIYTHTDYLYSFKGLRKYKDKYKPYWVPRYIVYSKKYSLFKSLYLSYKLINKKTI